MPKQISRHVFGQIKSMLEIKSYTMKEIAKQSRVSASVVSQIAHGLHFHQADEAEQLRRLRKLPAAKKHGEPHYLPTREEIVAECERIQAAKLVGCDVADYEDREAAWMPPVYSERSLLGA